MPPWLSSYLQVEYQPVIMGVAAIEAIVDCHRFNAMQCNAFFLAFIGNHWKRSSGLFGLK